MCCLTTSPTPLLWVHVLFLSDHKPNTTAVSSCSMCCLTTSPTPLLWVRVLCVVWPQVQHHCCKFVSFCCLTTSPTPLLWVCALCVVWPQAQYHWCEFVPYVLSEHKHNTTARTLSVEVSTHLPMVRISLNNSILVSGLSSPMNLIVTIWVKNCYQ